VFFVSHEVFDGLVELKLHSFFNSTLDESEFSASCSRLRLKCDGTRAETRCRLSAKRTSPFKSTVASVQSTTGSRGVRISGSNAGYTMFRGSVKGTGYLLHSPVFPFLSFPCVTVCHHISTGPYTLYSSRHKAQVCIEWEAGWVTGLV